VIAGSNGISARHFQTGRPVQIAIGRGIIVEVRDDPTPTDLWVAPAFWDIQLNGRWGISFSEEGLTVEQVARIVQAQAALGTARLCPTLISASTGAFLHGLRTIADACSGDAEIERRIVGIHLEGPYLSEREGYRGAHPVEAMRDPDWDEFQRFQDAAGGRIKLVTLAPERAGAIAFIARVVASGIVVAIGHTAADASTIAEAVDAGATLSTHLGNGIAASLPRHPNPIWSQAADDRLSASFIADGHHLDASTLKVLTRAKTPDRTILISDASPLAGLSPGRYGSWEVDPSGKIVVAGAAYLAGSNQGLEVGLKTLLTVTGWTLAEAIAAVTTNPAQALGFDGPALEPGDPANLVVFRFDDENGAELRLVGTCVDGSWAEADAGA
jgi:N-acetylglucosamine-6-phosphate deacetylase